LHVAVDRLGRLVKMRMTPGHRGDAPQAPSLLEGFAKGTVGHVVADAAYDSDAIREQVRRMKSNACIPPHPNRARRIRFDRDRYRNRNVVERFFGRIKRCRRVATRYEKKAVNFAGFVWLAAFLVETI
jgi:putative transposase